MILFVTGQYAGAQYIHPLLEKWSVSNSPNWSLVATGASRKYWDDAQVSYNLVETPLINNVAKCIDELKPSLIIVSASANIHLEGLFIANAKKRGITTASFIDIWANYLMRFKHSGELIFPDSVFAIDEKCAEEMIVDGIPQDIIRVIGQPYLEKITKNTPRLGTTTLLTSQPIKKYLGNSLGYDEADFWKICLDAIKKTRRGDVLATRHPDEDSYTDRQANSNIIWSAGQGIDDVADSHTVIGMFSMQMMVGYLWGRKVASIQPHLRENDPSPLSRWGLIPLLEQVDELVQFLSEERAPNVNQELKGNLAGSLERLEIFCEKYH